MEVWGYSFSNSPLDGGKVVSNFPAILLLDKEVLVLTEWDSWVLEAVWLSWEDTIYFSAWNLTKVSRIQAGILVANYTKSPPSFFFLPWRNSPLWAKSSSLSSFPWSHSDIPQSVGLLWTNDQFVAETSTWQHTTLITERHPCPGGIRTRSPSKGAAADPRLRPCGHW